MSRKIVISKYENNTHYNVHIIDSFGQEHHLGYYQEVDLMIGNTIDEQAEEIWSNETKNEVDLMSKAIKECIEIDRKAGRLPSLD